MERKKLSLSFVNGGKEFVVPSPTVGTQEAYLDAIVSIEKKKISEEKKNRESNRAMVLITLQQIDKTVTMKDILSMHPHDYMVLFNAINETYDFGKELGDEIDPLKET